MLEIKSKNIYVLIVLVLLGFVFYYNQSNQESEALNSAANLNLLENKSNNNFSAEKEKVSEEIIIHLSGAVKNAGVYKLTKKSRIVDLIKAAGGLKENADLKQINLAEKLFDGQKLIIPTLTQEKKDSTAADNMFSAERGQIISNNYNGLNNSDLININQVEQNELEKLSGIGPSKAEAIIKYRENNSYFDKKEDLLNVSGIGEKTLEKIRDEIILR